MHVLRGRERPQQVELNAELDKYLKMVEGKQARWPGVDVAAEQQAWLAQRDACRQDPDVKMCLEFSYLKRLSIMQAQFALVPEEKPLSYRCDGEPEPMTVRFHSTNPPLVTLERSGREDPATVKRVIRQARELLQVIELHFII